MLMRKVFTVFLALTFAGSLAVGLLYIYVQPQLPDVSSLKEVKLSTPLKIYSQDGKVLSQFGEKRRVPLGIDQIPQQMIDAFLATEDTRFYEHSGVDPIGIIRAAIVLITTGQKSQGASTITMQVARNFFLSREKTYIRKIKEIFVALHIEQQLSKDQILELYLNRSFFGNRAYGVGAAAEVYYGKTVDQLSLSEMAMIAGLPQSPSVANPIRNPERALKRRNIVLTRMLEVKMLEQEQYDEAVATPISATYHDSHVDFYAPYIAEMARNYLVDKLGSEVAYSGGYSIYTTIDSKIQHYAQEALHNNIYDYDERHGYRGPADRLWKKNERPWMDNQITDYLSRIPNEQELIPAVVRSVQERSARVMTRSGKEIMLQWPNLVWARKFISDTRQGGVPKSARQILTAGDFIWIRYNDKKAWQLSQVPEVTSAMVAMDPYDGSIKALVGGYNFHKSQYNRAIQANRQIGSNIKPFIYAGALEKGLTLASLINNAPINEWDKRQGVAWRPKNSPDIYTGPTRLRLGLSMSINVMSVRLMRQVGLDATIQELLKFGFVKEDLPRNESLALGSGSISPLKVARAYSVFANKGFLIEPFFINYIKDPDGEIVISSNSRVACQSCYDALEKEQEIQNQINRADSTLAPIQLNYTVQGMCPLPRKRLAVRVVDPKVTFLITQAMESVIWGGGNWKHNTGWTGTGWRASKVVKRRDIAGKTGTTNEAKDTWFSGFNPQLVATFWVGFDDSQRRLGSTMPHPSFKDKISGAESGAKTAGPGWNAFMKKALKPYSMKPFSIPSGIISVRIDRDTGLLSRKSDHTSRFEYFIEGTEPKKFASDVYQDTQSPDAPSSENQELFE